MDEFYDSVDYIADSDKYKDNKDSFDDVVELKLFKKDKCLDCSYFDDCSLSDRLNRVIVYCNEFVCGKDDEIGGIIGDDVIEYDIEYYWGEMSYNKFIDDGYNYSLNLRS